MVNYILLLPQICQKKVSSYIETSTASKPYTLITPTENTYVNTRNTLDYYATSRPAEKPYTLVQPSSSSYANIVNNKIGYTEVSEGMGEPYVVTSTTPEKVMEISKPYCYAY